MADGAGKLDKLSRLKSLRSGLMARGGSAREDDVLSLDTVFEENEPAPRKPTVKAPTSEDDSESLSAYFEALGIVPDGAKSALTKGTPPAPYIPSSGNYTKPVDKGREVDARDRWADPVREDSTYLASFEGDARPKEPILGGMDRKTVEKSLAAPEKPVEADPEDFFAAAGDEPGDDRVGPGETKTQAAEAVPPETADEAACPADDISASPAPDAPPEIALEAPTGDVHSTTEPDPLDTNEDIGLPDDLPEETAPDFEKSIDIEAFEREIAMGDATPVAEPQPSEDSAAPDPMPEHPLSVTFDADRAAMLETVSRQMGCSVDDVVVTAIDWYLDALAGEEDAQADATEA